MAHAAAGSGSDGDDDESVELLSVNWNQDNSFFTAATTNGFRIFNSEPFKEAIRREQPHGGFGIVEMLFRTNILGFVGGGSGTEYPPNKVAIWDDRRNSRVGEFSFKSSVLALKLSEDHVVAVLEREIHVHSLNDLRLLHRIETPPNPKGLCCLSALAPHGQFGDGLPRDVSGAGSRRASRAEGDRVRRRAWLERFVHGVGRGWAPAGDGQC